MYTADCLRLTCLSFLNALQNVTESTLLRHHGWQHHGPWQLHQGRRGSGNLTLMCRLCLCATTGLHHCGGRTRSQVDAAHLPSGGLHEAGRSVAAAAPASEGDRDGCGILPRGASSHRCRQPHGTVS